MRLTRTTYLGLFCCLAFVIYLRLTRRRRRRNIARLEALLDADQALATMWTASRNWASSLYDLQGAVQEVFPVQQAFPTTTGNTISIYSSYPTRGCCISDDDFDRLYERPIRKAESLPEFGGSA